MMVFTRLALQRRRLFVATLLSYLAALIYFAAAQATSGYVAVVTFSGASAGATLIVSCLIVLVLPALRKSCETLSAAALLAAILARHEILPVADHGAMLIGLAAAAALVFALLYGPQWQRLGFRFNWTTRRRFTAPCPAEAAWARLVPDPANPAAHYSGVFVGQYPVEGQTDHVVQITRGPDGAERQTKVTFHEVIPPHAIRYSYSSCTAGADYGSGDFSLAIWPRGRTCEVRIAETVHRLHIGTALELWFDNFGDEMRASMLAALSNRPDPGLWMRGRLRGSAETA